MRALSGLSDFWEGDAFLDSPREAGSTADLGDAGAEGFGERITCGVGGGLGDEWAGASISGWTGGGGGSGGSWGDARAALIDVLRLLALGVCGCVGGCVGGCGACCC